ncbi:hypothetical protein CLU96_2409 [Chryseobacterium sp. 52]|uniref:hypothetical protein n=1 Tax=Chryseobacterium sp. 52 TaxID=2035213 RepID=UPI000C4636EE|nr:hypothetical protein [Chryseobacterium sp. 52]PIF45404.1 hypothetical protein CLU96_2409 [Chryseobacterium sp. 52]
MNFLIKYGFLILLFLVFIDKTQLYTDFKASKSNLVVFPLLLGLMFSNTILIYINESKKKISHKTTNLILISFVCIFGISMYINYIQSNKEIVNEYYVSPDSQLKTDGYELKLYKDKTYEINEYWHGESQHYFGRYTFDNNILILNDKDIEDKTNTQVTVKYKLKIATKDFEPFEQGSPNLKLRNKSYRTN